MNSAVVALDSGFKVLIWNHLAQDIWGLTADEVVGESFWGVDIGLPITEIKDRLQNFMHSAESIIEFQVNAVNRRGKKIICQIAVTKLSRANKVNRGLLLIIHTTQK